jgi:hypothetical protein
MKRKLLVVLLVVSLAGNAVELVFLGIQARRYYYSHFGDEKVGRESAALGTVSDGFDVVQESLTIESMKADLELARLEQAGGYDTLLAAPLLDRYGDIERAQKLVLFQSRQAVNQEPDSAKRARAMKLWRVMTGLPVETKTRAGQATR